jgi:hypothetical protein
MTNDTQPRVYAVNADDPPHERKAFGMAWNDADAKSVIITVGGTVLGGLVLVLMVGLALVFAHYETKGHETPWLAIIVTVVMFLGIGLIRLADKGFRWRNEYHGTQQGRTYQVLCLIVGLAGLLVLVGIAAGIK